MKWSFLCREFLSFVSTSLTSSHVSLLLCLSLFLPLSLSFSFCLSHLLSLPLQFLCVLCALLALQALGLIIALIFEKKVTKSPHFLRQLKKIIIACVMSPFFPSREIASLFLLSPAQTAALFHKTIREGIKHYYDDLDFKNILDYVQRKVSALEVVRSIKCKVRDAKPKMRPLTQVCTALLSLTPHQYV